MHSPYDPKPSVRVENGIITELDGKQRRGDFDFLDQFIADYAIRIDRSGGIHGSSLSGNCPQDRGYPYIPQRRSWRSCPVSPQRKMAEVINHLNVVGDDDVNA